MYVIVGNWRPDSYEKGISVYEYEEETGAFTFVFHGFSDTAVSFLGYGSRENILYATNETDILTENGFQDKILALRLSEESDIISLLDTSSSLGPNPTWICTDETGNYLLATHHGGFCHTSTVVKNSAGDLCEEPVLDKAHIILFRLKEDGTFDKPTDAFLPRLKEPSPPAKMSRTHCIFKAPCSNLFLVCDKGLDLVLSLTIDYQSETLKLLDQIPAASGAAPRYGTCHNVLPIFYADMEGKTDVYSFRYDKNGRLSVLQILNVFPGEPDCKSMASDIIFDSSFRHLYVGFRGENLIAILDVDEYGVMSLNTKIKNPDGAPNILRFSPDHRFLFVTNIFEGIISQYKVEKDGFLTYIKQAALDSCPASMIFV